MALGTLDRSFSATARTSNPASHAWTRKTHAPLGDPCHSDTRPVVARPATSTASRRSTVALDIALIVPSVGGTRSAGVTQVTFDPPTGVLQRSGPRRRVPAWA